MSANTKPSSRPSRRRHPLRTFYIYTAESIVPVEANSLHRAVALSGLDSVSVLAVFDSRCLPQHSAPESAAVFVALHNPGVKLEGAA